jgi:hypothetical protein
MKILIVKGWLGFGDRLESLKMCVKYAQTNNLQLYVDWTDSIWTHGSENFYTYFKFVNMPVLNSLADIPAGSTFFPTYWNAQNITNPITQELMDNDKKNNTKLYFNIETDTEHKSYDVLVFSPLGSRTLYLDSAFFANSFRVVDPNILAGIRERLAKVPNLSQCLGIHARGTDRARNVIKLGHGIQFMALNAMPFASKPMIVVGDDAYAIEVWKRYYPATHLFTKLAQNNTVKKGNHNASKDELKDSKYDLTVEFLTDFFTLCHCERVLSTFKDSRFAHEARRLHPYVKQMLGNG